MSRNDAQDFAQRLYGRIPSQYRVYDADRGQPLLALLKTISAQTANLRQDLDALWDNFFIETCDDWVVPYIGALVGTNFLQQPIGQSNRLEVWNTVLWRRTKGAPQMLQWTSQAISQWPTDIAEVFSALGWSQNLNHVRLNRTLTPDLRDLSQLDLLGHAADPFAHAVDFKPARALDQPRLPANSLGVGIAAWGTPGRHEIKNLGVFVRRLQTFPVKGVTPTAAALGVPAPVGATMFKFNPLNRDVPLFSDETGSPVTRAAFNADPWQYFGTDSEIAVRQSGILLATEVAPSVPTLVPSQNPFSFGSFTSVAGSLTTISPSIRLVEPRSFQLGTSHFLITAKWLPSSGGAPIVLGTLSTLLAVSSGLSSLPSGSAFIAQNSASVPGQLIISVETGHRTTGSPSFNIPASSAARFPGAIVAVQVDRSTLGLGVHSGDGLYVYLPASFLTPGNVLNYYVADDGSTYTAPALPPATSTLPPMTPTVPPVTLARASQGQVYPPRVVTPSTNPANAFVLLNRQTAGMFLPDQTRFTVGRFTPRASVFFEAALFTAPATTTTSPFQALGGIATTSQSGATYQELQAPASWPPFTYAPSNNALSGNLPSQGLLSILVRPLGSYSPPAEVVLVNPGEQSLLVYLPEVSQSGDTRLLVADDGSTYFLPPDAATQQTILRQQSLAGLVLARAAQGQSFPIPGIWPLQQRVPVALNLCRSERSSLLNLGELGVDPELGHFALPSQDLALAQGNFSVDFMEAFGSFVGAVNSSTRQPTNVATRLVSQSGDANSFLTQVFTGAPVHSSLSSAVAAAQDGDIIEIVDSATYNSSLAISIPSSIKTLTIRAAAGQRPCLSFYQSTGQPAAASLTVAQPMTSLSLEGVMISGGPIMIQSSIKQLQLTACTLDPTSPPSLICTDTNPNSNAVYVLSRCVTGGLQLGPGVAQLTMADSIVDQRGSAAISGIPGSPPAGQSFAGTVQLERVTVFGAVFCTVLNASESVLNKVATVLNQQSGCIRFTRFEAGSVLPRRYRCIPTDSQLATWSGKTRLATPVFNSLRFCNPDYAQLMTAACPPEILSGSENGAEMGAFAGAQNTIRLNNLNLKLQEFMPVGLSALVLADT